VPHVPRFVVVRPDIQDDTLILNPDDGHLDAVHHLITCQVINLDGDQATCAANMQGTHVLANTSGGPIWTVGGRHDYQLKRTADGWKIAGLTFTVQWATGNMHIVTLAAAA
jgi:SnoaL-like domain